jgi:hypothetical protein
MSHNDLFLVSQEESIVDSNKEKEKRIISSITGGKYSRLQQKKKKGLIPVSQERNIVDSNKGKEKRLISRITG